MRKKARKNNAAKGKEVWQRSEMQRKGGKKEQWRKKLESNRIALKRKRKGQRKRLWKKE